MEKVIIFFEHPFKEPRRASRCFALNFNGDLNLQLTRRLSLVAVGGQYLELRMNIKGYFLTRLHVTWDTSCPR